MNAVKILNVIDVIERNSKFNWYVKEYNFDTKGNLIFQFKKNSLQIKLKKIPKEQYAIRETIKEVCFIPLFSTVYDDAIIFAENIKVFNRENWRLPTYGELRLLDLYFDGVNNQVDLEVLYWTTSDVESNKVNNKKTIGSYGDYFEMWVTEEDSGSILLVR